MKVDRDLAYDAENIFELDSKAMFMTRRIEPLSRTTGQLGHILVKRQCG